MPGLFMMICNRKVITGQLFLVPKGMSDRDLIAKAFCPHACDDFKKNIFYFF